MEKYTFVKEIGSGSFGKVFLVRSKQQGINYVVKQVDLNKLDRRQSQFASKEIEVLAKLRHNNIVSYKESYEGNNQLNIVLEYCENGDLHEKIKELRLNDRTFGENEILDYFVQICLALEYIHNQRILHRDLKTKNIFLTKGNVIKLGDFGVAKILDNTFELAQTCLGSLFYVSPEICESKPYNKKSDIWALGCVLYELSALKYAFIAKNVKTLLTKILTGGYNPLPTNLNIHIRSLIASMLKPNPKDRPSIREILGKQFLFSRRAKFTNKGLGMSSKRRSRSGDPCRSLMISNNNRQLNDSRKQNLSLSCLQINQLKDQRKMNIYNPEAKYKPVNVKKSEIPVKNERDMVNEYKNEDGYLEKDFHNRSKPVMGIKNQNSNFVKVKNGKLPKVDSEYYDLIAGRRDPGKIVEKKEDDCVGKQTVNESRLKHQKPDSGLKMSKNEQYFVQVEGNSLGVPSMPNLGLDFDRERPIRTHEGANENRKKWVKNTLQRKTLLAILSETDLMENSLSFTQLDSLEPKPRVCVDDLLRLSPSEMSDNILLPVKLHECYETPKVRLNGHFSQLIRQEIIHIREKYEQNDRRFQLEDLIRLTYNSKKILKLRNMQEYGGSDEKSGDSVFSNLEQRRMTLERKVGFCEFLRAYGKMRSIINNNFQTNLRDSLNCQPEGTKTYIISTDNVAGDNDDNVKNTWKSIICILGDKEEHLPDIWELAVYENLYYHI